MNYTIRVFLIIGIICGGLLAYAPQYSNMPSKFIVSIWDYWVGFFGITFLLVYQNKHCLYRLIFSSVIASFLSALPFAWQIPLSGSLSVFLLCVANAYTINALHLKYSRNQLVDNTSFDVLWDPACQLFIALCFALLCSAILYAWGELFAYINITFFQTLFKMPKFYIWAFALFFSMGLFITTQSNHFIQQYRFIVFTICRYLLPPLAIIGIVFVVSACIAFIFTPHTVSFASNRNFFFLYFSFFSALFFNGIYQTETSKNPYSPFLSWIIRIFLWIAPLFALLVFYSVYRNVMIAENFAYAVNILLLLLYNVSYAVINLRTPINWFTLQRVNTILGIILILATLFSTNPWVIQKLPKTEIDFYKMTNSNK